MSFDMALPHTQRVQAILPDGQEVLPEVQELWDLYRAAETAITKVGGGPGGAGSEEGSVAAVKETEGDGFAPLKVLNPQRVLDRLQEAKSEMDVVVDLVSQLEAAQFLAVAHAPRRVSVEAIARDRALALAARQVGLRSAAARLRQGADALAVGVGAEATLLADLAQLQGAWLLRRAGLGFQARLLPERLLPDDAQMPCQAVLLEQTAMGRVMCDGARGVEAVTAVLRSRQEAAVWQGAAACLGEREGVPPALQHLALKVADEAAQHAQRTGAEPMDVDGQLGEDGGVHAAKEAAPAAELATSLTPVRYKRAVLGVLASRTGGSRKTFVELAEALQRALIHEELCCDVEVRLGACPNVAGLQAVRHRADVMTVCFRGNGVEGAVVVKAEIVELAGPFWPEEWREVRLGGVEELEAMLRAAAGG